MRFLKFKVSNYKSFLESAELRLAPGINVIVGQNNSGKTALLEAMSFTFGEKPHRSLETMPSRGTAVQPSSSIDYTFVVDAAELRSVFTGGYVASRGNQPAGEAELLTSILNRDVEFRTNYSPRHGFQESTLEAYPVTDVNPLALRLRSTASRLVVEPNTHHRPNIAELLPLQMANIFRPRVYFFRAERMTLSQATMGPNSELAPNAANLAQVLNFLSTDNPSRFERFLSYVGNVFPQIHRITAPPVGPSEARILVWTQNADAERNDLAIPLNESGTGIGQVLAMLYVLVTSDFPRVILIDEPQSFLHPSAIRKLLEIFAAHPMHQYVITTHSPTALASNPPSSLTLLTMDGAKTIAKQVNPAEATELRAVLAEVGARLSDVFGADNVLWVEGPTEEACFPLIRGRGRESSDRATGTVILGVRHTSDFRPRDVRAAVEIYHRLSTAQALMPPAVGFIFDPEGLSAEAQQDIARQSGDRVRFLPRRMFENYLLVPDAIGFVMNSIEGFSPAPIQTSDVSGWIAQHKWGTQYFDRRVVPTPRTEEVWLRTVHGAKLLGDMFSELSEPHVVYDKVRHGVKVTTWICEHDFGSFREIVALIREAIARGAAPA